MAKLRNNGYDEGLEVHYARQSAMILWICFYALFCSQISTLTCEGEIFEVNMTTRRLGTSKEDKYDL